MREWRRLNIDRTGRANRTGPHGPKAVRSRESASLASSRARASNIEPMCVFHGLFLIPLVFLIVKRKGSLCSWRPDSTDVTAKESPNEEN